MRVFFHLLWFFLEGCVFCLFLWRVLGYLAFSIVLRLSLHMYEYQHFKFSSCTFCVAKTPPKVFVLL